VFWVRAFTHNPSALCPKQKQIFMSEELNTNPTPPAVDALMAPVHAPIETPITPPPVLAESDKRP